MYRECWYVSESFNVFRLYRNFSELMPTRNVREVSEIVDFTCPKRLECFISPEIGMFLTYIEHKRL